MPLIHPSIGWGDVGLTAIRIVFRVSVVDVGAGRLVGDRSLANAHSLDTWFAL